MSLELNAKETALVLIDLEHGIVARDSEPYTSKEVVKRCAKLAEAFRTAGSTVVYVHVLMHEIVRPPSDKPAPAPPAPPPPEMSELVPEAGFREGDILIAKRQWDAFHATNLDQALRRKGTRTIVLGGIATNIGVESTARAAHSLGYAIVFASDAMATTTTKAMQEFALETMFPIMGKVRTVKEIAEALE